MFEYDRNSYFIVKENKLLSSHGLTTCDVLHGNQ